MALIQITEPHQWQRVVGIDLGTTHSLVATVGKDGKPHLLRDETGQALLPSAVYYGNEVAVGYDALAHANKYPTHIITSAKRLMGRSMEDLKPHADLFPYNLIADHGMVKIETAVKNVSPIQVSADILRTLVNRAQKELGGDIEGAVITVPAYFDETQRQSTRQAAEMAHIRVMRLLNEPTAAALAYHLEQSEDGLVAIYDMGGGTFDISILRLSQGVFEVVATGGDTTMGGDDMDRAIARWVLEHSNQSTDISLVARQQLLTEIRTAKENLSRDKKATIKIAHDTWVLDQETYHHLIEHIAERSINIIAQVLHDAKIQAQDLDQMVMVGGASRTPYLQHVVTEWLGRPPLTNIDPECAVALGAALQAHQLGGNEKEGHLLLDVTPLSLGVELMGELVEVIIPRNTPIPVSMKKRFTTFRDGQQALKIHIVQGERDKVSDCRSLAHFELRNIPPMAAGKAQIEICFTIDADGLLSVSAEETLSGQQANISVQVTHGLSDNAVMDMINDSVLCAGEDLIKRQIAEAQTEAKQLIHSLHSALVEDGDTFLEAHEKDELTVAIHTLEKVIQSSDAQEIKAHIARVNDLSTPFAHRRMDQAVRNALVGNNV